MKILNSLLAITCVAAMSSCNSSGSSGTPLVYTAGGLAFKSVSDSLNGAKGLAPGPSASIMMQSRDDVQAYGAGLAAFWSTDAFMSNPKYDGTGACSAFNNNVTLKDYMGTQFDENQKRCNGSAINVFGRLKNASGIMCIMLNNLTATTSAALVGAAPQTISFNAATIADLAIKCPMISLSDMSGQTATLTFSAPGVTTTYDLKIVISPFNETVLMKYGNGNAINFATYEDNSNGRVRTLVTYNTVSKVLLAEYVSKSKGTQFPLYVHRLFKDETNGVARIFSSIQSGFASATNTSPSNMHTYIVSGNPSTAGTLAFSTVLTGYARNNGTYEACVNSSNGAVTTDGPTVTANAFSCGTAASASFNTPYATAVDTGTGTAIMTATTAGVPSWHTVSTGSEVLNWSTKDNMLTSGF